ncbi:hypothetical protein SAMN04488003_108109 [Loktanella fryxellensis]|uniref:Uncharacterized protein n=1 Tax=Loktanella fryxellensis TaxID=245187 RepID=A0A1H8DDB2_9RHOB|nr:hypothetical protein [Loktanella fryxellensis]SEN05272.1 hypothetical protein SAMN04488003_108109 [Loktanella fryxellensis]
MAKVAVGNPNTPGKTTQVDAAKYEDMRAAMLAVTSSAPLTAAQIKAGVLPHLSPDLFPAGQTAGWWLKCVQLDLEVKQILQRHPTTPLTWTQA